jgi:benzoylformate decarboxylase
MLMNTDTLLFVGCSTNTTLLRHESPLVREDATCIHVGDDPDALAKRQSADAAVLGDPGAVLAELAERVGAELPDETRDARLEKVRATAESLASTVESMGVDETPEGETRPSKADLVDALQTTVPDAFVVDEGITAKYPLLTRWEMGAEGMFSNKGGGLGYGLPAAIGAAFAERERGEAGGESRPVLGYVGDGSYLYYPHAMYTAARHDLDMTVVIPDNRNYRILKNNTNTLFGGSDEDHEFIGMDFDPHVDIPANARSHGASAGQAETPEELEGAIEEAVSTPGPYVLDVLVHD